MLDSGKFKRISLSATAITTIALMQTQVFAEEKSRDSGLVIEDIVVTASKRTESVQSTPYNITATSGEALEALGAVDLTKLGRTIPGVSTIDRGPRSSTRVVIRGLSVDQSSTNADGADGSGGTVGTYINDSAVDLDFKLLDLERVEGESHV